MILLPEKDVDTSEAMPLKQKLANQKAKLASHGRSKPVGSSQLKPKEWQVYLSECFLIA